MRKYVGFFWFGLFSIIAPMLTANPSAKPRCTRFLANPPSLRLRSLLERGGWWESTTDIYLAMDILARRLRSSC